MAYQIIQIKDLLKQKRKDKGQARTEDFLQGGVKSEAKCKPLTRAKRARFFLPPLRGG